MGVEILNEERNDWNCPHCLRLNPSWTNICGTCGSSISDVKEEWDSYGIDSGVEDFNEHDLGGEA